MVELFMLIKFVFLNTFITWIVVKVACVLKIIFKNFKSNFPFVLIQNVSIVPYSKRIPKNTF